MLGSAYFVAAALMATNPSPSVPTSSPTPSDCVEDQGGHPVTWPAPVLPAAFVARYPDGVSVAITVDFNALGHVLDFTIDSNELSKHDLAGPLGTFMNSWVKAVTFDPPIDVFCRFEARSVSLDVTFHPAASGITAKPPIVGGANFDEMTYTPGSCSNKPTTMHLGLYDSFSGGMEIQNAVTDVFTGSVGGVTIAVVRLVCHIVVSYTIEARVYRAEGGVATYLGSVDTFDHGAPDSPRVESDVIYVSFRGGLLYVDSWVPEMRCKANDWNISTYSVRGGKLVLLHKEMHHRGSIARACS